MAVKFTLVPSPTFKADVKIPRAGLDDGELTFTFKHLPLNEVSNIEKAEGQTGLDFAEKIIEGWALPEAFNRENLEVLANNYPKAIENVISAFYRELLGNREKN
ncbi:TPA: phage tail assembly chaperone [Yersinia enterocolitica]